MGHMRDRTIHLVAYYLNPYYHKDKTVQDNALVMIAVIHCICAFFPKQCN